MQKLRQPSLYEDVQGPGLYRFGMFAVGMLIFLLTLPNTATIMWPGLDNSYALAFNYFFVADVQIGKEISFTYGPLGFLEWPQPQGNNLVYAHIIYTVVHMVFVALLLWLVMRNRGRVKQGLLLLLILFFSYLLSAFMYLKLVFICGMFLLLHYDTRRLWLLLMATGVVVLAGLIRSTYGILGLIILASYVTYLVAEDRKVSSAIIVVGSLAAMTLIAWFLIYRDVDGLLPFLKGVLEFSSGNSSAMTVNPQNNWWLLTAFIAVAVYLPFSVGRRRAYIFYVVFGLSVLAYLKYAFSREGSSLNYAFVYLLFVFFLFTLFVAPLRAKHYFLIASALVLFGINMKYYGGGANPFRYVKAQVSSNFSGRSTPGVISSIIHHRAHADVLLGVSQDRLRPQRLSERTRRIIGRHTVDAYPYEISYIAANGFNYQPRPVLQSYIAYTPYLDAQNAQFFRSPRAPNYLLWEAPEGDLENNSIDSRYVLNDEPMAILEILGRYSPLFSDGKIVVLKHNGFQKYPQPRPMGTTNSQWQRWVQVPANDCSLVRGKLIASRTFLGKLKRLFYKEEEFFIEYKLAEGGQRKHRFVIDNAISGLWVTPYVQNIWKPGGLPVAEIKVTHSDSDFLKPDVRWDWECIPHPDPNKRLYGAAREINYATK